MNNQFSIYRMENNVFLGDCLSIVYHASPAEIKANGLTNPDIAIYVKTPKDISIVNSIEDLGNNDIFQEDKSIMLRIASECQFGMFGDSHCDCESQRMACLDAIKNYGQGIYIQLPQEGQGHGLYYKAKELQLQVHGTTPEGDFVGKKDIFEASEMLTGSKNVDKRSFSILKKIFEALSLNKYNYTLVSSNPRKTETLANEVGISILGAQDVKRELNLDNVGEYLAKIYKKSFALSDEDMKSIYEVIFNAKKIPDRVSSLLRYIGDDLKLGRKFSVNEALLQKVANLYKAPSESGDPAGILDISNEDKYREFQIELVVSDTDIKKLVDAEIIDGISDFAFEQNYFYDLVYFRNTVARDLKIRRKSRVSGKKELLESRLVYKVPVKENEYDIKSIAINDKEVADLLANSLEGYEVHYVPVFTHTCEHNTYPDVLILIKRYSLNFKTISIMGKKESVEGLMKDISRVIEINKTPDPTHIRTINKAISLDFDYDKLAKEELSLFKKYYRG